MKRLRSNQERPDLRYSHDEKADVLGGTLYRQGLTVQVWWHSGPETWTGNSVTEAQQFFTDFKRENT